MKKITDKNFKENIASGVVLVNFTAAWCQPCKLQKSILSKFEEENENIQVCQVDIDESSDTALNFGVNSIPAFIWFVDGEPLLKEFGLKKKEAFEKMLAQVKKDANLT